MRFFGRFSSKNRQEDADIMRKLCHAAVGLNPVRCLAVNMSDHSLIDSSEELLEMLQVDPSLVRFRTIRPDGPQYPDRFFGSQFHYFPILAVGGSSLHAIVDYSFDSRSFSVTDVSKNEYIY